MNFRYINDSFNREYSDLTALEDGGDPLTAPVRVNRLAFDAKSPVRDFLDAHRFEPMVGECADNLVYYIGLFITEHFEKVYSPHKLSFDHGKLRRPVFEETKLRDQLTNRIMRHLEPDFGEDFTGSVSLTGIEILTGFTGRNGPVKERPKYHIFSLIVEPRIPKIKKANSDKSISVSLAKAS